MAKTWTRRRSVRSPALRRRIAPMKRSVCICPLIRPAARPAPTASMAAAAAASSPSASMISAPSRSHPMASASARIRASSPTRSGTASPARTASRAVCITSAPTARTNAMLRTGHLAASSINAGGQASSGVARNGVGPGWLATVMDDAPAS